MVGPGTRLAHRRYNITASTRGQIEIGVFCYQSISGYTASLYRLPICILSIVTVHYTG